MSRDAASAGGDRTELSQQFYREYKEDLLYAAGLGSRPIEAGDRAAIERAFTALGWTRRQQLMFADGAPADSIFHTLRSELRKPQRGSGRAAA